MLRKNGEYVKNVELAPMNGAGEMLHETLFASGEFTTSKVRLCARMTLAPGASVGPHPHFEENEVYYVIQGEGTVEDNGRVEKISAGEATLTTHGNSHNITNTGKEPLVFLALVIAH